MNSGHGNGSDRRTTTATSTENKSGKQGARARVTNQRTPVLSAYTEAT